jgi:hypothetical protein
LPADAGSDAWFTVQLSFGAFVIPTAGTAGRYRDRTRERKRLGIDDPSYVGQSVKDACFDFATQQSV